MLSGRSRFGVIVDEQAVCMCHDLDVTGSMCNELGILGTYTAHNTRNNTISKLWWEHKMTITRSSSHVSGIASSIFMRLDTSMKKSAQLSQGIHKGSCFTAQPSEFGHRFANLI